MSTPQETKKIPVKRIQQYLETVLDDAAKGFIEHKAGPGDHERVLGYQAVIFDNIVWFVFEASEWEAKRITYRLRNNFTKRFGLTIGAFNVVYETNQFIKVHDEESTYWMHSSWRGASNDTIAEDMKNETATLRKLLYTFAEIDGSKITIYTSNLSKPKPNHVITFGRASTIE